MYFNNTFSDSKNANFGKKILPYNKFAVLERIIAKRTWSYHRRCKSLVRVVTPFAKKYIR